jgi:hypothetical protein
MKSLCFALAIAISGAAFAQDSLATASIRAAASEADGSRPPSVLLCRMAFEVCATACKNLSVDAFPPTPCRMKRGSFWGPRGAPDWSPFILA